MLFYKIYYKNFNKINKEIQSYISDFNKLWLKYIYKNKNIRIFFNDQSYIASS